MDESEDDDDEDASQLVSLVSVLQRANYGVLDEQAVLLAGRRAFLENQPGQSEENAELQAGHLGAALYQIAHARGWDSLTKEPGLMPLGSIIRVVAPTERIVMTDHESRDGESGEVPFGVSAEVLYTEENFYS